MSLGKITLAKEAFNTHPIKTKAKDEKLSEVVSFRVESAEKRKVDEILAFLRNEGSTISTPSDVYRWAGEVAIEWLGEQITSIAGDEGISSWLVDQIELDKLDRQLDDQIAAEAKVKDQLRKLKEFSRSKLAVNDWHSVLIAMDRLAESIAKVSDNLWKATMKAEIKKDTELKEYQDTLSSHGYYTHLYNHDVAPDWEG